MNQKIKKYLYDIQQSIISIDTYLKDNKNFTYYENSKMLRRAVEREIEIIGEALNKISKLEPKITITNARRIIDTRNFVIHGYDKVDNMIIWAIITKHLPLLLKEIEALLENN